MKKKKSMKKSITVPFGAGCPKGSTQHSSFAQGVVFITSGGSTPILRQRISTALTVFIFSFILQSSSPYGFAYGPSTCAAAPSAASMAPIPAAAAKAFPPLFGGDDADPDPAAAPSLPLGSRAISVLAEDDEVTSAP